MIPGNRSLSAIYYFVLECGYGQERIVSGLVPTELTCQDRTHAHAGTSVKIALMEMVGTYNVDGDF